MLTDVLIYIRRLIKSPSNTIITDSLLIDYVNRFWLMDVDARMQLFDLKTKYQFETTPGIDQYNMPLSSYQNDPNSGSQIASFPLYQGFLQPARVNGINIPFYTQTNSFYNLWPNYIQQQVQVATGDGGSTYSFNLPFFPVIPGHVDITGVIASTPTSTPQDPILGTTLNINVPQSSVYGGVFLFATGPNGQNILVQDSGQFLSNNTDGDLYGLLMEPGQSPGGGTALAGGYSTSFNITGVTQANPGVLTITSTFQVGQTITINNVAGMTQLNGNIYIVLAVTATTVTINVDTTSFTPYISGGTATSISNVVNYNTGQVINVSFPAAIPAGTPISAQCYFIQPGIPRAVLFFNNCLTLRPPPSTQFLVELEAYLTPAAFFESPYALPFGYMAEYIARGAARKILADTGDWEQFDRYESLFREQEMLVWKRSQRQFTATRTETIYSNSGFQSNNNQSSIGL